MLLKGFRTGVVSVVLGRQRAMEPVDLFLLAEENVLDQVLDSLAGPFGTGRRNRLDQGGDHLFLAFDERAQRRACIAAVADAGYSRSRLAGERNDFGDDAFRVGQLGRRKSGTACQRRTGTRARSGHRSVSWTIDRY